MELKCNCVGAKNQSLFYIVHFIPTTKNKLFCTSERAARQKKRNKNIRTVLFQYESGRMVSFQNTKNDRKKTNEHGNDLFCRHHTHIIIILFSSLVRLPVSGTDQYILFLCHLHCIVLTCDTIALYMYACIRSFIVGPEKATWNNKSPEAETTSHTPRRVKHSISHEFYEFSLFLAARAQSSTSAFQFNTTLLSLRLYLCCFLFPACFSPRAFQRSSWEMEVIHNLLYLSGQWTRTYTI